MTIVCLLVLRDEKLDISKTGYDYPSLPLCRSGIGKRSFQLLALQRTFLVKIVLGLAI